MQETGKIDINFLQIFIQNEAKIPRNERPNRFIHPPPLADLLNPKHELYQLAHLIDWKVLDDAFGEFFAETQGAPALPTRLIAGLHYLKHAFARSDEAVVAQWLENPYWQYFCGAEYFQHQMPCHPTSLTYWRKRIGEAGCEWMLSVTIQAGGG